MEIFTNTMMKYNLTVTSLVYLIANIIQKHPPPSEFFTNCTLLYWLNNMPQGTGLTTANCESMVAVN